jgi:hypothetical protein
MAGLESARMFKPETMIEQQHTNGAPAAELQHGVDCPKAAHIEGRCDYLHDANDDNPYDDGETMYCGRCHYWMGCPVENVIESESGRQEDALVTLIETILRIPSHLSLMWKIHHVKAIQIAAAVRTAIAAEQKERV